MFTLRTITTAGLLLVLTIGTSGADDKNRSGKGNSKGKVQQSNRSRAAGITPPLNTDKGEFKTRMGNGKFASAPRALSNKMLPTVDQAQSGTGNWPMPGPKQATDEEIIKALNNGTQLRSTVQQGNVIGRSKSARQTPKMDFGDRVAQFPKSRTRSYTGDLFDLNSAEWLKAPTTGKASKFKNVMRPRTYEDGGIGHHDNWRENDR